MADLVHLRIAPLDDLFDIAASLYNSTSDSDSRASIVGAVVARLCSITDDLFSSTSDQLGAVVANASVSSASQALFCAVIRQNPKLAESVFQGRLVAFEKVRLTKPEELAPVAQLLLETAPKKPAPTALTSKAMAEALGELLRAEAISMGETRSVSGRTFGSSCVLRSLLSPTSILPMRCAADNADAAGLPQPAALRYFSDLRGFPRDASAVQATASVVQESLFRLQDCVHQLLLRVMQMKGESRPRRMEAVQSWLAAAAAASLPLVRSTDRDLALETDAVPDSGFLLNLAVVCLLLSRPLVPRVSAGVEPKPSVLLSKYMSETIAYLENGHFRLGWQSETRLCATAPSISAESLEEVNQCSGDDEDEEEDEETAALLEAIALSKQRAAVACAKPFFLPEDGIDGKGKRFSFVTEVFFMTSYTLHTTLLPMFRRFNAQLQHLYRRAAAQGGSAAQDRFSHFTCGWLCHLLSPHAMGNAIDFSFLVADWFNAMMDSKAGDADGARALFSSIPAFMLADIVDIWIEGTRYAHNPVGPGHFASPFPRLMDPSGSHPARAALFICNMMRRSDIVASAIIQAKFVDLLSLFLIRAPVGEAWRAAGSQNDFAGAVLNDVRIRKCVAPSLMTLYAEVHAPEGLDVDVDSTFDKFSVRHKINRLLTELWGLPALTEPKESILNMLSEAASRDGSKGGWMVFHEFVVAMVDTVLYKLDDSIERMDQGHRIETARKARGLPAVPPREDRSPQSGQYFKELGLTRAWRPKALSTLDLLLLLCKERRVPVAIMSEASLVDKMAKALLVLLGGFVGDDAKEKIRLENPVEWGHDGDGIVHRLASLCAVFFDAAQQKEGSANVFAEAIGGADDWEGGRLLRLAAAEDIGHCVPGPVVAANSRRTSAASVPAANVSLASVVDALIAAAKPTSDVGGTVCNAWIKAAIPPAPDAATEEASYVAAWDGGDLKFGMAPTLESDNYAFFDGKKSDRFTSAPPSSKNLRREIRRLGKLPSQAGLPAPHPDGAVAVRFDETCLNSARFVIFGPVETPYAGGAFVFDVFFPSDYPNIPPLVQFMTTSGGTERLNANLYADGKVCLSLLGNFNGDGSRDEKWNPERSTLEQIVISIQAEILTKDPYYNEPGRDRTLLECQNASRELNSKINLQTIRHAMVGVLRRTPPGLESVVATHFRTLRERLLRQCQIWVRDATSESLRAKLMRASSELKAELDKLDVVDESKPKRQRSN